MLYDLYAYVWDIRNVISLLNSYVKWLGKFVKIMSLFVFWSVTCYFQFEFAKYYA